MKYVDRPLWLLSSKMNECVDCVFAVCLLIEFPFQFFRPISYFLFHRAVTRLLAH